MTRQPRYQTRPFQTSAPQDLGFAPALSDRLDSAVQSFIDAQQLSGAVIIVARHGAAAHFEARGMRDVETDAPMSKDTIFRIYSMTKAVGSVAAMMLCEEGKLQLDAPVSHYLPELQEMQVAPNPAAGEHTPVAAKQRMTVRDLLRHTSGLPGNVAVDTLYREAGLPPLSECNLREIVAHLNRVQLLFHPGTQWYYSIAADIVGRLVEVASGRLFDEFLAERIFQPLGMEDTGFHVPADKLHRFAAMYGPHPTGGLQAIDAPQGGTATKWSFQERPKFLSCGGGLVSTGTDYLRFCLMLAGKGALAGRRLLQADTVELMTRNQLPMSLIPIQKQPQERYQGLGFGLGFSVRVQPSDWVPASQIGEYGWIGGASTEFWIAPQSELVAITLAQYMPFSDLSRVVKQIVYDSLKED